MNEMLSGQVDDFHEKIRLLKTVKDEEKVPLMFRLEKIRNYLIFADKLDRDGMDITTLITRINELLTQIMDETK